MLGRLSMPSSLKDTDMTPSDATNRLFLSRTVLAQTLKGAHINQCESSCQGVCFVMQTRAWHGYPANRGLTLESQKGKQPGAVLEQMMHHSRFELSKDSDRAGVHLVHQMI